MRMMAFRDGTALTTGAPARVCLIMGASFLLALATIVTPAKGFALCASGFGQRPTTTSTSSGYRLAPSMPGSYGSFDLGRRDSAKGGSTKKALTTRVGPRPILSVPAALAPDSPEAPPPESSSLGASPPKGPSPYQAQERDTKDLVYGETATRSFVKALVWRITAAVITLISGLVFSGSLSTAMSIVGSDFVTKSGFMFLGERLWNKVKWGQGKKGDSAKRSLAKALLWRVFAASNTLICGVFLAKDFSVASKIAGSDTVVKTGIFFVNERVWSLIDWGKKYEPEYFI